MSDKELLLLNRLTRGESDDQFSNSLWEYLFHKENLRRRLAAQEELVKKSLEREYEDEKSNWEFWNRELEKIGKKKTELTFEKFVEKRKKSTEDFYKHKDFAYKFDETNLKLGIRFGDNDFYYTFQHALPAIAKLLYHMSDNRNKDMLLDINKYPDYDAKTKKRFKRQLLPIINLQLAVSYNTHGWQTPKINDPIQTVKSLWKDASYLKVKRPSDVYINEEVDAYIKKCDGWDNAEFFVVEYNMSGIIKSFFSV